MGNNRRKEEKRFRERLAREFQVDRPPESYFQAVQSALDSLPEELPVKAKPLGQRVLRACAACAACLVLLCAGGLGANLFAPSLMESLPGVGQLFRQINGTGEPSPQPDDAQWENVPTPQPQEAEQEAAPLFQPVTVEDASGALGALTLENAACDGSYLRLDLAVECWDPSCYGLQELSPCEDPYQAETDQSYLQVDGVQLVSKQTGAQRLLTPGEDGVYRGQWIYALSERREPGEELEVYLELPTLFGNVLEDGTTASTPYPAAFSLYCSVTVDGSLSLSWEEPVTDNGVTLEKVEVTAAGVVTRLEIPYFGRVASAMASYLLPQGGTGMPLEDYSPLGVYGVLTTEDGQALGDASYSLSEELLRGEPDFQFFSLGCGPYRGAWAFEPPPQEAKRLVLTLYEYDPDLFGTLGAPSSQEISRNRVTAEFTIDLERGTVYPSTHYLEQGRVILSSLYSADLDRRPQEAAASGYYCGVPIFGQNSVTVTVYTEDLDYHPLALYCYWDGTLVSVQRSYPSEEFNASDSYGRFYQDELGTYRESLTDPAITQWTYKQVTFSIDTGVEFPMDNVESIAGRLRLELVDLENMEVVVEDVIRQSLLQTDEVLGTRLLDAFYGQAGGGTGEASEVSPSPAPPGVEEMEG